MESLRQQRTPLRNSFTRTANALEETLRSATPNLDTVVTLQAQLQEKGRKLADMDKEYLALLQAGMCSQDEYNKEFESAEGYADRLSGLAARCSLFMLNWDRNGSSSTRTSDTTPKRKYRLPELELKKFAGDSKDWLGFWAQYRKIHEDADIDPEDKFQYLIQSTVVNSRARQLVESFPPTAESYAKVIDSLKSRFGRDDSLVEVYVRELLRLVLTNAVNPRQSVVLSVLYDKLELQLRALESLGVTTDKYAAMLYPLVESCLPEDVLKAWERNRGYSVVSRGMEAESTVPVAAQNELSLLMGFLRKEVDGEERITLARTGFGL